MITPLKLSRRPLNLALLVACLSALFPSFSQAAVGAAPLTLLCPSNIVVHSCADREIVRYPNPVASGGCGNITVSCQPPSGSAFPLGVTTVACQAVDECDNVALCNFTIAVRPDITPPQLHCPPDIERCGDKPTIVTFAVTATDSQDPAPQVTCSPPSGSAFPVGTTVVTCSAVDACGNEARCEFRVTIRPDAAPSLAIEHGDHIVTVCWRKACRCYRLQSTGSLQRPVVWTDVATPPVDMGDYWCVRLPLDPRHRFFRLVPCERDSAPVFHVTSPGLTPDQSALLAEALGLPPDQAIFADGALLFMDTAKFQSLPMGRLADSQAIAELTKAGQDDEGPVVFETLDFAALKTLRPIAAQDAVDRFERALRGARLLPSQAHPVVTHSWLDAVNLQGEPLLQSVAIDTHVAYEFNLAGIPLSGPGAKLRLALGADGQPTAMHAAIRELKEGPEVPLIGYEEAARRCARLYPNRSTAIQPALSYFAPSTALPAVQALVPCFDCGGEAKLGDGSVRLLSQRIPATDDPAWVPHILIQVEADGARIRAKASVEGGLPPYAFQWISSSTPLEFPEDASSIEYEALPRNGQSSETLRLLVTDANGVQLPAVQSVALDVDPKRAGWNEFTGLDGIAANLAGVPDYGIERAVSDMGAGNQAGFKNRFDSEGIARRFNWSGLSSWERDFKEGPTGLDHLYVDNADLVFYIGHGYGGGITFEGNQDDGQIRYEDVVRDWGNRDQEWMALLSCEVLRDTYDGKKWWQRWGPAFDGLHLLLGFETLAYDWSGFGGNFADWTLGRDFGFFELPPVPLRTAWFLANNQEQPSSVISVVMGVIGPGGCVNYNDYFWGKGPVGPDIRGSHIQGWWRVRHQ